MSPLQLLKGEEPANAKGESKRNKHRRFQAQIATAANTIITCQAIAAVWKPELREGLNAAWPILATIFSFNAGIVMAYLYVGSQENRHAAELDAIMADPRLRRDFKPASAKSLTPPKPRFSTHDASED